MHFLDLPEEIQEYVFYLAYSEHPATDTTQSAARSSFLPLLLVNQAFHRIGTPILYYSIRLSNSATATLLARTLEDRPSLYAPHIRALQAALLFPSLSSILQALSSYPGRLANLDLGFNIRPTRADLDKYLLPGLSPFERDEPSAVAKCCEATVEALSAAFTALAPGPHTLVLKRLTVTSNKTYVDVAFGGLARALPLWTSLRSVKINFFLLAPSDASESPDSANSDGERALAPALARVPGLQSVRAPLPRNVNWSAAWPLVASNDALQRVEMTVPHVSARARLAPVIEPVPGRVTQAYYELFPSAAGPNGTAPPAALADLASVPSPSSSNALSPLPRASLAERLRGPVEVVSKFGHFYDRTDKTITLEDRALTAEQILRDGEGGVSAWLVEARKHRRLVDLMLAGASDTRSGFFYY